MPLSTLLARAHGRLLALGPQLPLPCTLFFSLSDGRERAHIVQATGDTFQQAWQGGVSRCQAEAQSSDPEPRWLRIDWTTDVRAITWGALRQRLAVTKRNYFRFGIALDADFRHAFLESELNANAMLYLGGDQAAAALNEKNFAIYARRRYGPDVPLDFAADATVYMFAHDGLFVADDPALADLPADARDSDASCWVPGPGSVQNSWKTSACLNAGRRAITRLQSDQVLALVESGAGFLAKQVQENGQFVYGHFPCFGRTIRSYNTLRHASTIYSMLEAWELMPADDALGDAIRRALVYLDARIIRRYPQPDGSVLAFNVNLDGEIKLGANAVSLLALVKYDELTGDVRYRPLMDQLALGILYMQQGGGQPSEVGRFVHVLDGKDLSVKEKFRIIYYDGEAAFGLMRLYGLTRDDRWLFAVEKAFDYFLAAEHWRHHDHWLSYCVNELTRYRPEARYFKFGVDNIVGLLDFILTRETTFPTLLELSMAFWSMLRRVQKLHPDTLPVLLGLDIEKFEQALHYRAHYLLNGFFWPEVAMYFDTPKSILGSFFIRHHSFRVRIDDVEHYLSGYVAYWDMLRQEPPESAEAEAVIHPEPKPHRPVVAWGGDVNLGRRQHYRTVDLGVDQVLRVPALASADLGVVNLECVVATVGEQGAPKGEGGPYYYRARPELLSVLAAAGVKMVATANNHSGDYGPAALMEQARWLAAAGFAQAGSGPDRESAFQPAIRPAGDLNVALFSVDATQHRFAATAGKPGTAYLSPTEPQAWAQELTSRIEAARQQAHVVLVAVHWGANQAPAPGTAEVAIGHALIEAGADAVLGASAHVLHGIEIYRSRPIIYDAGDLLFDAVRRTAGESGVFRMELSGHGVERVEFAPVGVGFGFSEQLAGTPAQDAAQAYVRRCEHLGTRMVLSDVGTAYVDLQPPARPVHALRLVDSSRFRPEAWAAEWAKVDDRRWRVSAVPVDARIEPVRLGPLILLGVRVNPLEITHRQMLWVETFWTVEARVEDVMRLDIRAEPVRPTTMPDWGRAMDHDPCDWMLPTDRWRPGAIYRDYYGLRPPDWDALCNVDLRLLAGLVSRSRTVPPVKLPCVVRLAIPGRQACAAADPVRPEDQTASRPYRTDFSDIELDVPPGQTWTAAQLAAVTGGQWLTPPPPGWFVCSVVSGPKHVDLLPAPTLFVGHDTRDRVRHEQSTVQVQYFDRHLLIPELVPRLAGALVRDESIRTRLPADFPLLKVEDPVRSMIELGLAARQRYTGPVIAVTGTVGKSSTVSMLQTMLGGAEDVFTSIDNYNSRVRVPACLASLDPRRKAAVIEVAQSALWMKRGPITQLIRPTVSLITEIGLSQTQSRVRTLQDVARWKSRIFTGLSGSAVAVVGEHLACFDQVLAQARAKAARIVRFGRSEQAEVRITSVSANESGSHVELALPGGPLCFNVPLPSMGMVNNAVAAVSVVYALGQDVEAAVARLQSVVPSEGRMQQRQLILGGRRVRLIDDSFNAEVASMNNAFSVLKDARLPKGGRKIAVLGRIVHLGDMAKLLHESLSVPLLASGVDHVVTHGREMAFLRDVLPGAVLGPHFTDARSLIEYLLEVVRDGDLVLVKGSRRDSDFGRVCGGLIVRSSLPEVPE